jgi:hypothetical protein
VTAATAAVVMVAVALTCYREIDRAKRGSARVDSTPIGLRLVTWLFAAASLVGIGVHVALVAT